jgi:hypothetical protein
MRAKTVHFYCDSQYLYSKESKPLSDILVVGTIKFGPNNAEMGGKQSISTLFLQSPTPLALILWHLMGNPPP